MKTEDFAERLAQDVTPVRPLPRPWIRAALWSLGASLCFGVLMLLMTSRDDLAANTSSQRFMIQQLAAIATGVSAAAAAFVSVVPGYSRRVLLLPAAAAGAWLVSILLGVPQEWNDAGLAGLAGQREWPCVVMIVLGGALPALVLALMLRRGAPLTPRLTMALSVLAATALANVVACVSEPHPSSIAVLVWHGSTVLALLWLATGIGPSVLTWRTALRD